MKSRNRYELKLMRESGKIAGSALKKAIGGIRVGVSELEIERIAWEWIHKEGGELSYKSVPGYKYATCITVNDQVVHGIPTERKFASGDLVSVDLAVEYRGWHTDCAWSVLVDDGKLKIEDRVEKLKFLKVGEEALWEGINNAVEGNRIGDISSAIQNKVEGSKYHIVRSLVGHGIGKSLHEDPQVPGYGTKGEGSVLKSGMTLAIEVIYTKGTSEVKLDSDGWTYLSLDNSLAAVFEMSVVVGRDKTEVLTRI